MSSTKQLPTTLSLYIPLFIIFIIIAGFFLAGTDVFNKIGWKLDYKILQAANIFWLLLSMLTLMMQKKALENKNPNVFVRAVMGSMLMKMMAGALAVLIYFMASPRRREAEARRGQSCSRNNRRDGRLRQQNVSSQSHQSCSAS